MSDQSAGEWLAVAATELAHIPATTLRLAAAEARKTCNHHGQIIPAILASDAVKRWEAGERLSRSVSMDGTPRLEKPRWRPEPGETAQIIAKAAESLGASR